MQKGYRTAVFDPQIAVIPNAFYAILSRCQHQERRPRLSRSSRANISRYIISLCQPTALNLKRILSEVLLDPLHMTV